MIALDFHKAPKIPAACLNHGAANDFAILDTIFVDDADVAAALRAYFDMPVETFVVELIQEGDLQTWKFHADGQFGSVQFAETEANTDPALETDRYVWMGPQGLWFMDGSWPWNQQVPASPAALVNFAGQTNFAQAGLISPVMPFEAQPGASINLQLENVRNPTCSE